jgi:hypothetical protein
MTLGHDSRLFSLCAKKEDRPLLVLAYAKPFRNSTSQPNTPDPQPQTCLFDSRHNAQACDLSTLPIFCGCVNYAARLYA